MTTKQREAVTGSGFLAFSILVYIASFGIKKLVVSRIGAAFVPQLAASLLAGLSVLMIIQALLRKPVASADPVADAESEQATPAEKKSARVSVWATIGLLVVYGVALEKVGFLVTTALYLFFQFWVLGLGKKKNYVLLAIISVLTAIAVYALFVYAFDLMLPAGILG